MYLKQIADAEKIITIYNQNETNVQKHYSLIKQEILTLLLEYIKGLLDAEEYSAALSWLILGAYLRQHISILSPYYTKQTTMIPIAQPTISLPVVKPISMGTIGAQRNTYVSREALLRKLDSELDSFQAKHKKILFISGMGGVGKSELARAYAYTRRNNYKQIIFLSCVDNEMSDLDTLLRQFSSSLSAESFTGDADTLIIVDNFNNDNDIKFYQQLLEQTGEATLLITTRLTRSNTYKNAVFFSVDLTEECANDFSFAQEVFKTNYQLDNLLEMTEEDIRYSNSLIRKVGLNTIAIVIIASYLRESGTAISAFSEQIQNHALNQIPDAEKITLQKDSVQIEDTINHLLKYLFQKFMDTNEEILEAREIFTLLSISPGLPLRINFFEQLLTGNNTRKMANVKAVLRNMQKYNWIQSDEEYASLHPLIAEIVYISADQKLIADTERMEFFSRILTNWLSMHNFRNENLYFMSKVYSEYRKCASDIMAIDVICTSVFKTDNYIELAQKYFQNKHSVLIGYIETEMENRFLYYDLDTRLEGLLLSLASVPSPKTVLAKSEAQLLVFIHDIDATVNLALPDSLGNYPIKEIPDFFFAYMTNCISKFRLPSELEQIGESAFEGCNGYFGNLYIPDFVITIGERAFRNCEDYIGGTLHISNSVTSIGEAAFYGCCGFTGNLYIPDSVIHIGNDAFNGCIGFTGSLHISNSVSSINDRVFYQCSDFTGNLHIPDSVISIGEAAFYECSGFTGDLYIPNSITSIGRMAFWECSGFTGNLYIPNSVTSIGSYAFWKCSKFTGDLYIADSVISIGEAAFYKCSGFTGNLHISNSVSSIKKGTFRECSGFTGTLHIPHSVTTIMGWAFYNCGGFTGELHIPNSITYIGAYAFGNCSGFTGKLHIPNSVTTIQSWAFSNCSGFTGNLHISNSITHILGGTFLNCSGFTGELHIPDSVSYMGEDAFNGCSGFSNLSSILQTYKNIIRVQQVHPTPFNTTPFYAKYISPRKSFVYHSVITIDDNTFTNLFNRATNSDFDLITYNQIFRKEFLNGNLYIHDSVTSIDRYAFKDCFKLTGNLYIPNSVTSIGEHAFAGCSGFSGELYIPNSVTFIGEYAFENCRRFTGTLHISNSITSINAYAFSDCTGLTKLHIPNSVTSIGAGAFRGCCGFTGEVHIPDSVTFISRDAFMECCFNKYIFHSLELDMNILYLKQSNPIICARPNSVMEKTARKLGFRFEYLEE